MTMPGHLRCSVVIPTYNRSLLLEKSLVSLAQAMASVAAAEVIVVDDGSTDDTAEVVRSLASEFTSLKYVYQEDRGYRVARARNLGIRLAEGDICVFVDSGMIVGKEFIKAHLAAHNGERNAVCIGKILGIYSGETEDVSWLARHDVYDLFDRLVPDGDIALSDPRQPCFDICGGDLDKLPMPWAIAWTANISMSRTALVKVGGFDENYQSWGCEDLDLSLAMSLAGSRFKLVDAALAVHLPHEISEHNQITNRATSLYMHRKFALPETEMLLHDCGADINLRTYSVPLKSRGTRSVSA